MEAGDCMARMSNEQILEIRNNINIVDVVGEYLPLVQKGRNYFGVCPFHDDHNPSMSVSKEKQIYTCFVCGATGNVFNFLMDYEKITFMDAVYKVAEKTGIKLEKSTKTVTTNQKNSKLYDMYEITNKYYHNNLLTSKGLEAKKYLQKRGITEEIIKEFGIGVSFKDHKVYPMLKSANYNDNEILQSGLCNKGDTNYYDMFNDRIMFPLYNLYGNVVGFSGRIYHSEDTSKYVNSRESEIFKKGELLYNYHRAKDEIRKAKYVIIVEGFMDVIALYKVGIKNAIATMGTAITKEQANLIKRLSNDVVLLFDGDKAGEKATMNCGEELLKLGVIAKVVRLEDNLDPDEYITKESKEDLIIKIEHAMSLFDFKTLIYKQSINFNNPEEISAYINKVIKELQLVDDIIVRELTIEKLSKETGVSKESIQSLMKPVERVKTLEVIKKPSLMKNKYEKAEEYLLYYMLKHKEVIRIFIDSGVFLSNQTRRYLASEMVSFYHKFNHISEADFMTVITDKPELFEEYKKISSLGLKEEYTHEEINDYINVISSGVVQKEKKRLETLIKMETDPIKKMELANQALEILRGEL